MGSGSSNAKPKQANKSVQASPVGEDPRTQSPVFRHVPRGIPPKVRSQSYSDDKFHIETNVEDYSSVWDHETKVNRLNRKSSIENLSCFSYHHHFKNRRNPIKTTNSNIIK